jgi:N-acetylglucosamine kinase-like BadF-type ATPase
MTDFILLADSGATKTEWKLIGQASKPSFFTSGLSPYHMESDVMVDLLKKEFPDSIYQKQISSIFFYGTGCKTTPKANIVKKALSSIFPDSGIHVTHDLMGAAIALCGNKPGIACILGTGSNSCEFNGKKITFNSPGLGFILGDEGSGAYMGKKVITHYLYQQFDKLLTESFEAQFKTNKDEILHKVYKEPYPNRYLASFAVFLSAQRGHYIIENIIEDGLRSFFDQHIVRYKSRVTSKVNFVGSIAFHFKDKIVELCDAYGFDLGEIMQQPMNGLAQYHTDKIIGNIQPR